MFHYSTKTFQQQVSAHWIKVCITVLEQNRLHFVVCVWRCCIVWVRFILWNMNFRFMWNSCRNVFWWIVNSCHQGQNMPGMWVNGVNSVMGVEMSHIMIRNNWRKERFWSGERLGSFVHIFRLEVNFWKGAVNADGIPQGKTQKYVLAYFRHSLFEGSPWRQMWSSTTINLSLSLRLRLRLPNRLWFLLSLTTGALESVTASMTCKSVSLVFTSACKWWHLNFHLDYFKLVL